MILTTGGTGFAPSDVTPEVGRLKNMNQYFVLRDCHHFGCKVTFAFLSHCAQAICAKVTAKRSL